MSAAEKIETIGLTDLVPDRCNYKDVAFEKFVDKFMNRFMPGFNISLLDTSNFERWEIEPEYTVVEDTSYYAVDHCDEDEWNVLKDDDVIETFETEEEAENHVADLVDLRWEIRDSEGELVEEHDIESCAEDRANELNGGYGFPWANNWCFMPQDDIRTEDLKAAGFTVANYIGGKGDWREDITFRLCGIDGGGYSFSGQHYAKLVALVHERWECQVDTDSGRKYIKA